MKKKKKVAPRKSVKHEIVVSVQSGVPVPTTQDLMPIVDGKRLMIPKTWLANDQVIKMVQHTPRQYVYKRKGRGGQMFDYVTGSYITKVLNFVFGWNWDFEVTSHGKEGDMIWVLGRLTVKDNAGHTITKTQFGRAEIKYKKDTKQMLDFGNDLKAATTDALKKCASLLGIASDIYGKTEFHEETGVEIKDAPAKSVAPNKTHVTPVVPFTPPVERICFGARKGGCSTELTKQEFDYSKRIYGKPLCRSCQQLMK